MKIQSLQIGKIKDYGSFKSAFIKDIYLKEAFIDSSGIDQNEIADQTHHGGKNKAIFANAIKNYPLWENFLQKKINFGFMGENLSITELDETNVCIGDIHKIGQVILQVSEPRKPCIKISMVHCCKNFTEEIFKSGLSGWYYRVLKKGTLSQNDTIQILEKNSISLSILELNHLFFNPKEAIRKNKYSFEKIEKLENLLSQNWRNTIKSRLNNTYNLDYMKNL